MIAAGENFKRPWLPLIKMDEAVRKEIDSLSRKEAHKFEI